MGAADPRSAEEAPAAREAELIAGLSQAANLPAEAGAGPVEVLTTHASLVFRTPQRVYKCKRAKDWGFLDYTTAARRAHFCAEEVRLNRRGAPGVYLGVLPVWRDAQGFSLVRAGRPGAEADWAVAMRTLPDSCSALSLLAAGALGAQELHAIAARIARFHRDAAPAPPASAALAESVAENFRQAAPFAGRLLDGGLLDALAPLHARWLARHAELLASRPACEGHGDLRLEHVYLLPEGPALIDCIEFSERLRVGDPALDVAFLAMDLRREGRPDLAEYLLARWTWERDDQQAYALLDGAMSYRALVRAKVACLVAADPATAPETAARKAAEAGEFLRLAHALLAARPVAPVTGSGRPLLLGIGGMIASGKSTLADALGAALGLPVLSADALRKSLAGLAHGERGGPGLYAPEFTARVQGQLLARADVVLDSGRSVLLDTTFGAAAWRARVAGHAAGRGAAFLLLECRVPEAVMRERLRARTGGVSDAREELADRFLATWEPFTGLPPAEHLVLDGTRPVAELVAAVRTRLAER
ncbi:MAG TPA: AAA family ATPase [Planctomycetota bacterium]|nr:AAA family ATPase [Planctomycetota bacterium]